MIKYYNASTGEEVKYGETHHFEKTFKANAGTFQSAIDFPIINETIPFLIQKGYIVQKEEKEDIQSTLREDILKAVIKLLDDPELDTMSCDEKINICLAGLIQISKSIDELKLLITRPHRHKKHEE